LYFHLASEDLKNKSEPTPNLTADFRTKESSQDILNQPTKAVGNSKNKSGDNSYDQYYSINNLPSLNDKWLFLAYRNDRIDCSGYEALYADPQQQKFNDFLYEYVSFDFGKLNSYISLGEAELIELAENANPDAMYILGMNYMWHSYNETFINPILIPGYMQDENNKPTKEFDLSLLEESRKWLYRAAVHKYPSALTQLIWTYATVEYRFTYDGYYIDDKKGIVFNNQEELDNLSRETYVIRKSIQQLMPNLSQLLNPMAEESITRFEKDKTPEVLTEIAEEISKFTSNWKADRFELGLPMNIEQPDNIGELMEGARKKMFIEFCDSYDEDIDQLNRARDEYINELNEKSPDELIKESKDIFK
jgi:hypothetical protein